MKKLAFTLILFAGTANAQNSQMSFYTLYEGPVKSIMPNMNDNFGIGMTYGYKPLDRVPGYIQLDLSTARNSSLHVTGNSLSTNYAAYTTTMNKYLIGTKFITGNDYSLFRFYATPQFGLVSFKSTANYNITVAPTGIYNDHDADDAPTTKTKHLNFQGSNIAVYGGQIGTEISLNRMFKLNTTHDNRLLLSANLLQSNQTLSYINLDNIRNVNVANPNENVINLPNNSQLNKIASTEVNHTKFMMWGMYSVLLIL